MRAYPNTRRPHLAKAAVEVFVAVFKRISLFILTNLAILVALNVVLGLLDALGEFDAELLIGK